MPANKSASSDVLRNPDGTVKKGSRSPNPSGRPPNNPELVEAFRARTPRALEVLEQVMADYMNRELTPKGDMMVPAAAAVKAAEVVVNRGYGTAPATVELKGELKETVTVRTPLTGDGLIRVAKVLQAAGVLNEKEESQEGE